MAWRLNFGHPCHGPMASKLIQESADLVWRLYLQYTVLYIFLGEPEKHGWIVKSQIDGHQKEEKTKCWYFARLSAWFTGYTRAFGPKRLHTLPASAINQSINQYCVEPTLRRLCLSGERISSKHEEEADLDSRARLPGHPGGLLTQPPQTLPGLRQGRQGDLRVRRPPLGLPLPHRGPVGRSLGSSIRAAPALFRRLQGLPVLLCAGHRRGRAVGGAPGFAPAGQLVVGGPQALRPSLGGRRRDLRGHEHSLGGGRHPDPRLPEREVLPEENWIFWLI